MLFNSYVFIFLFLPLTLAGFYLIKDRVWQLRFLLVMSCAFYSYWSAGYVLLMIFTIVLDFYLAKAMDSAGPKGRRALLYLSLFANLSVLGFFKYFYFFFDSLTPLLSSVGIPVSRPEWNIVLPIGISFYTFQSLSYVIDVYRRSSAPHARLLEFASYVTFFPHLISGPLVRHNSIVPQLEDQKTFNFNPESFWSGINLFIFGLAKKMLLADRIAPIVDSILLTPQSMTTAEAWVAILGYSMQIYFDFSGYSDMAIGLGRMMNIQFPQNFNSPYKSKSITEFWQRWHISLSSWLRDYLYISLGGNRKGLTLTYLNLLLTMLIGGLWHGASVNFIIWGGIHGVLLVLERFLKQWGFKVNSITYTFCGTMFAWIFFRAATFNDAILWVKALFSFTRAGAFELPLDGSFKDQMIFAMVLAVPIAFYAKNTWEKPISYKLLRVLAMALGFVIALTFMSEDSPFLYFQF